MCLFAGLASAGTALAGGAAQAAVMDKLLMAGVQGAMQMQAGRAQNQAAGRAMEQNKALAVTSANQQYQDILLRQLEEQEASAVEIERLMSESRQAGSTAALAGAEAGISGGSLEEKLQAFSRAESQYQLNTQRNMSMRRAAYGQQMRGTRNQAEARIESFRPNLSYYGLDDFLLGVGTAGVGAYYDFFPPPTD